MNSYSLFHLSDGTLLRDLVALVTRTRTTTAALLAHLAEVDARKLYVPAGYPSMYVYCVEELRLSEDAAAKRIQAARAAREFPILFDMVADGRLHLTAVGLLAPHLVHENVDELTASAAGKSKAEIKQILAERFPTSEALPLIEAVPVAGPFSSLEHAPAHVGVDCEAKTLGAQLKTEPARPFPLRSKAIPISRERFSLHLTFGRATRDKLRHAQTLLGNAVPPGDLAAVLDRVLDLAIGRLEKERFGMRNKSRSLRRTVDPRRLSKPVKAEVWRRDHGQCTFVSEKGGRCCARERLEFDHVVPVARGGRASVENLRLRCRAHNQYEAERTFGKDFMRRKRDAARQVTAAGREETRSASNERANEGDSLATRLADPSSGGASGRRALPRRSESAHRRASAGRAVLPGLEDRATSRDCRNNQRPSQVRDLGSQLDEPQYFVFVSSALMYWPPLSFMPCLMR